MRIILICLLLLFFNHLYAQVLEEEQFDKEPQDLFELNVNGKTFKMVEGKVLKIDSLIRPQMHVLLLPEKKFENSFCSFQYDRRMYFDYNADGDVRTWTLNGPSVSIMLFDLPISARLSDIAEAAVSKFPQANCTVSDTTVKFGSRTLRGKVIDIEMPNQHIRQEYYTVEFFKGGGGYILLEDVMDGGYHSYKYDRFVDRFQASLIFKAKVKQ
jgi:hypothetical protein